MRGVLSVLAIVLTIAMVPVAVAIALDYGDHLRHSREMQRIFDENRRAEDENLLAICKNYREFQKMPEGRDTHAMDQICTDVENRLK